MRPRRSDTLASSRLWPWLAAPSPGLHDPKGVLNLVTQPPPTPVSGPHPATGSLLEGPREPPGATSETPSPPGCPSLPAEVTAFAQLRIQKALLPSQPRCPQTASSASSSLLAFSVSPALTPPDAGTAALARLCSTPAAATCWPYEAWTIAKEHTLELLLHRFCSLTPTQPARHGLPSGLWSAAVLLSGPPAPSCHLPAARLSAPTPRHAWLEERDTCGLHSVHMTSLP